MPSDPPEELLATAIEAADAAAAVHRRHAGSPLVEEAIAKGRSDFVSRVDLESQEAALRTIRERFPSHDILAEEYEPIAGAGARDSGVPLWIVDPLDGTTNFLHGHPAYAASVAVAVEGRVIAGAVRAAASGDRWWALQGAGAFRNGEPIHTSPLRALDRALVGTGFPFKHLEELPDYLPELERVLTACAGVRRCGSAALDLCYLAQGSLDAFWEGTLAPWDVAAGIVILREAGGVATRRDGSSLQPDRAGSVLAANSPELLRKLRSVLESG